MAKLWGMVEQRLKLSFKCLCMYVYTPAFGVYEIDPRLSTCKNGVVVCILLTTHYRKH